MEALQRDERPAQSIEDAFRMHDHYSMTKYFSIEVSDTVSKCDLVYRGLGDDTYTEPHTNTGVTKHRSESN